MHGNPTPVERMDIIAKELQLLMAQLVKDDPNHPLQDQVSFIYGEVEQLKKDATLEEEQHG